METDMKTYLILIALTLPLWAAPFEIEEDPGGAPVNQTAPVELGLGLLVGNSGFGASGRVWIRESWGVSLNVFSDWKREVEGGELLLNYKLPISSAVRPYVLAGAGLQNVNLDDVTPTRYNQNLWTFSGGVGAEALLGSSHNYGISLELSYLYGELDYSGRTTTAIGASEVSTDSKTKSVSGINAKLLYHYYFKPVRNKK